MARPRGNIVDRLVAYWAPERALRRVSARNALARAYEAASPMDPWRPKRRGASPATDYIADASILRDKARALYQNVPYVTAGIDGLVANYIGTGITCHPTGPSKARDEALWGQFVQQCDADGLQDLAGLQTTAARAMEVDGEVFIRRRTRRPEDGYAVPLQIQLLEADYLDVARNTGASGSNVIVGGKEFDALGTCVAYWMFQQHPGDPVMRRKNTGLVSVRVPASEIIHLYDVQRPGQQHGITTLAPIISRVRDTSLYEDAELARKNLESRLSVIATGDAGALANVGTTEAAGGSPEQTGSLGELPSGGIVRLPAGMTISTVAPTAAPGYVENLKFYLHIIASGLGVPYEVCTGDFNEVSFSAARMRWIEFRRRCEQRQWQVIVPRMLGGIRAWYVETAMLAKKLPRDVGAAAHTCRFATPRWEYVNPKDDVQSELDLIAGGLGSFSDSIRRRGEQPATVFAELQTDIETLRASGVLEVLLALRGKPAPAPADAQATQPTP